MLGVDEGAPSVDLCSFRKVSLPSWGRTSCRAAPPALDLKESTVGWDRQTGRKFWSTPCGRRSLGVGRDEKQKQVARTDLPQMPHGVPHLEDREEFTKVGRSILGPRQVDGSFWSAPTWVDGTPTFC